VSGFQPTGEQEKIRDAYLNGGPLAVTAGAGTGKTSTLVLLGEARRARVRYVAFNKSIALEAERRFPKWVRPSTAHSLAWQAVGARFRDRMDNQRHMPAREVARLLKINEPLKLSQHTFAPHQVARLTMETVTQFCYSAALEPNEWHAPRVKGIDSPGDKAVLRDALVPLARRAWADLMSPDGRLRFQHDHYLKFWQLGDPSIDADVLFVDECQDLNPVLEAVIARQDAQVVAVGDASQQLYAWRGATDALERLGQGNKLTLSQSFRFGPAVACEANKWLGLLHADLRLSGTSSIPSRLCDLSSPKAILARSNGGVMKQVIAQVSAGRKVAMPSPRPGVPGGAEIERLAKAAISLKQGRGTDHPEFMAFQTWAEVQDYAANDPGGEDLAVQVDLIDEHTPEKILTMCAQLVEERYAEVVVSTIHKAKGREWESVAVEGFRKPKQDPETGLVPLPARDQMMAAYVAVTRAKLLLDRGSLSFVDDYLTAGAAV
jgi:AAA domain